MARPWPAPPAQWHYYDPATRHHHPVVMDPTLAALNALQSQFTVFQDGLGRVGAEVKDVLDQLHAMRTAQNKTDMSIAELEGLIGVSTGARSRGRVRRGRAKGAKAGEPDVDATDPPQKTLIQFLSSIQSAVDELAHSRPSQPPPPSPLIESCRTPTDPSQPCSAPQSAVSPSPHSITTAASRIETPSPKEHADASIQACPSPPSCTFSLSLSGFRPFPWNPDPGHNAYPQLPTMSPASFSSGPSDPVPDDSATQRARSIVPTALNPLDTSIVPTSSGIISSESSSIPSSLTQSPSLTPEGADSSMTSPDAPPLVDTRASSPLSSLSSINDTPIRASGSGEPIGCPVPHHTTPDKEDVRVTADTRENGVPVTGGPNVISEPIPAERSFPLGADDGGSTPQSETSANDNEPLIVKRAPTMGLKMIPCVRHPPKFPVIPTPRCLTPEPLGSQVLAQGSSRQGSLGAISESLSLSTPPLLSPLTAVGSPLGEEDSSDASGEMGVRKVVDENTDATVDAKGFDAPVNDPYSRPRTGQAIAEEPFVTATDDASSSSPSNPADIEESTSATHSEVPVQAIEREPRSIVVSPEDPIPVSRIAANIDIPIMPMSLAEQPDIPLPGHHYEVNSDDPYSLLDAFTFGFSSSLHRASPSLSTAPSRNATPSFSHDPSLARDEDEVWRTVMLGASGASTPLPDSASPLMLSHQHSRASSVQPSSERYSTLTPNSEPELLAINPSMLHCPVPLPHVPGLSSPQSLDGSLSPLTSLADSDVDSAIAQPNKKPRATAPANRGGAHKSSDKGRRSEPYRARQPSRSLGLSSVGPVVRAASQMSATSGSRVLGGPDASLEELMVLAMRKPPTGHLRLRDLKRKRDAVDDGGDAERGISTNEASQQDQEESVFTEPSTSVPRRRVDETSTPSALHAPESATGSGLFDSESKRPGTLPTHRKRIKKKGAHGTHKISEQVRTSQQKLRLAINSKSTSTKTFHFRYGQLVSIESEREPTPEQQLQVPVTPSALQPSIHDEQSDQNLQTPTRKRHRRDAQDDSVNIPSSSPVKSPRLTQSDTSVKENARPASPGYNVLWPDLPTLFGQWHVQFIQCDNCDMWYHYGCVAIESGDQRLESGVLFICPTCQHESARRQTLRHHTDTCARPDCPEPQFTEDSDVFFVEKLVGRKKTEGYIYLWLAKWEGFPMTQATWIPKENVVGDGAKLFNNFQRNAENEGADLSQDMVLLKEALEAGWGHT